MEWSADAAMREMWSQLPNAAQTSNGDMMLFFKAHLQMAFDAGRQAELMTEMDTFDRFVKR